MRTNQRTLFIILLAQFALTYIVKRKYEKISVIKYQLRILAFLNLVLTISKYITLNTKKLCPDIQSSLSQSERHGI